MQNLSFIVSGADHHHCNLGQFSHFFYRLRQQDVVKHLFRVASSLDSMIFGEPQILGQIKRAYATARTAGGMDGTLNDVVSQALAVARRVRTAPRMSRGIRLLCGS